MWYNIPICRFLLHINSVNPVDCEPKLLQRICCYSYLKGCHYKWWIVSTLYYAILITGEIVTMFICFINTGTNRNVGTLIYNCATVYCISSAVACLIFKLRCNIYLYIIICLTLWRLKVLESNTNKNVIPMESNVNTVVKWL